MTLETLEGAIMETNNVCLECGVVYPTPAGLVAHMKSKHENDELCRKHRNKGELTVKRTILVRE